MLYKNKEWLQEQLNTYSTVTEISKATGYSCTTITRWAEKFGIYKKKFTKTTNVNYIDEDFFKQIDSPEKAYFLGLFMADGNMYKYKDSERLQFTVKLKSSDIDILNKLCDCVNFDKNKIKLIQEKRNDTICYQAKFQTYNKNFCTNLIDLGIVPQKTGKEFMPDCNGYERDFIRGFFDGDGWVLYYDHRPCETGCCSQSKQILEQILNHFKNELNIDMNILYQECNHYYKFTTGAKNKVVSILSYLYYDNCIALNRKQENAKKIINKLML